MPPLSRFLHLLCPTCEFGPQPPASLPAYHRRLANRLLASRVSHSSEHTHAQGINRIERLLHDAGLCAANENAIPSHPRVPFPRHFIEIFLSEAAELTSWSFNTLQSSLAALAYVQSRYKDSNAHIDFRPLWEFLQGLRRQFAAQQRSKRKKALPLQPSRVQQTCHYLFHTSFSAPTPTQRYGAIRDATAFAVAYAFGLRNNEVTSLELHELTISWNHNSIHCYIDHAKTDQAGTGVDLTAPLISFGLPLATFILRHAHLRTAIADNHVSWLFLALPRGRPSRSATPSLFAPWSPASFISETKKQFAQHVPHHATLSGHSFRRGAAKELAEQLRQSPAVSGLRDMSAQLCRWGRWSNFETALEYITEATDDIDAARQRYASSFITP